MKKIQRLFSFSKGFLVGLLISGTAFAGLPPTQLKGQFDSGYSVFFNSQYPNQSVSSLGGVSQYIDTGNRNLLQNSSFENTNYSSGWTVSNSTGSVDTTNIVDGKQSISLSLSSQSGDVLIQSQNPTPAPQLLGTNLEASCKVKTTLTTVQLCGLSGGAYTSCVSVPSNGTYQYVPTYMNGANSGSTGLKLTVTGSSTGTINVDDCYVGPARGLGNTSPVSDWKSDLTFSASAGFGTVTNSSFWYRQVGDSMEVRGFFNSGTVAGSTAYIQLPTGYTINTAKLPSTANAQIVGYTTGALVSATTAFTAATSGVGKIFYDGSTNNQLFITYQMASNALAKVNGSAMFSTGQGYSFVFTVPITSFVSSFPTFTPQASSLNWSGYQNGISGGCSTTSTSFADPSSCTGITLTQTTNRNFGTVTSGTGPSLNWTPARTGNIHICSTVQVSSSSSTTGNARLVDGSGTVIVPGFGTNTSSSVSAIPLCGAYTVTSLSALVFKVQLAASTSGPTVSISQNAPTGSAAIQWEIIYEDNNFPSPAVAGNVIQESTTGTDVIKHGKMTSVCTTGTCTMATNNGFSSCAHSSTGVYTCTYNNAYSAVPDCSLTATGESGNVSICRASNASSTSSQATVNCFTTGTTTAIDAAFTISCVGPK